MNMRSLEIVEALLDLHETLKGKMALLIQQFPEYTAEQIEQMAEADPTSPRRADYITWLLRLRRQNAWDGTPEIVRPLLARFVEIKAANWAGYEGERDISRFTSIDELNQALEANKNVATKKQKADTGAKKLKQEGDLTLWQMLNGLSARRFAVGKGTVNAPQTLWCTIAVDTAYNNYILPPGGLFTVTKAGEPYAQVCFGSPQAKNIQNRDISTELAKEIAPLFSDPMFDDRWSTYDYRPTGWEVNNSHIEKKLAGLIGRWYNEQLEGYHTNEWIGPKAKTLIEARESLRKKLKSFFDLFVAAIANQDEQIIRQIGERHGSPGGIQALFNAVYERRHPQGAQLPPLLQDYAALEALYDKLVAAHEAKNYPGHP